MQGRASEPCRRSEGPIMIDPETRDIVQNVYIRLVEKQGEVLANIEIATIPMVKDPWKELNPLK
jgi:branched-chain amino acid transport system substrate-binding protein